MRAFLQLLPVMLSFLLLGAHFLRSGDLGLVGVCALLLIALLIRDSMVVRFVQAALLLGTIEWIRTLVELVAIRTEYGLPWMRLAIILGAVTLFTLASAGVFYFKALRTRYGFKRT